MGKLSIDLKKLVVRKVAERWSQITIAKHLNISRCTVQNIIKKVKEHGTIENLPKICRPRMNSERTARSLILDAKNKSEENGSGTLEKLEIKFANLYQYCEACSTKIFGRIAAKKTNVKC